MNVMIKVCGWMMGFHELMSLLKDASLLKDVLTNSKQKKHNRGFFNNSIAAGY